jgi:hypothetical protein
LNFQIILPFVQENHDLNDSDSMILFLNEADIDHLVAQVRIESGLTPALDISHVAAHSERLAELVLHTLHLETDLLEVVGHLAGHIPVLDNIHLETDVDCLEVQIQVMDVGHPAVQLRWENIQDPSISWALQS